ncbi:exported protein of unknown function [Sterolibacterium denitrificans]|uniref:Uncharacterized protein n=2 Tax=Sterolibacterium denitrificans TaxID=157592 RepID=A0A7Z7HTH1_9PROT|nr:hypothetical protein [Sterolibacterium denitrificans]KYC29241.1 hypothetical protein ACY05_01465 [Sterolibacterium denitrificans]SMB30015.1 exported protein of unknown function [Sterolibacterium denitrificans]
MNKLLALLVTACLCTSAYAARDAEQGHPTGPTYPGYATAKPPAVGEAVTPANDAAALNDFIDSRMAESQAAKAKAAGDKK